MLTLSELLRVPFVDGELGFDISPDGSRVMFSWNKSGRWELYELEKGSDSPRPVSRIVPEEGTPGAALSPTVRAESSATAVRNGKYSPDGRLVAYAVDLDGSESYCIFLQELKSHRVVNLTPQSDYAHQPNFDWSPDGKQIAVLSDEHGQFSLYVISLESGEKKLLLDMGRPIWDVTWSPDGKWIAVEAESTASDRSIYIVATSVARPSEATEIATTQLALNAEHPSWSPDSRKLAFSGESGEWHDIGIFDLEKKEITWITSSIGDDSQPTWSPDGSRLGWVHAEGARTSFQLKERNGEVKQFQIGTGVHAFPRFTSDSVILLYEDPSHPTDLWKIDLRDGNLQQLTNSMPEEFRNEKFVQPIEVWYQSKDGVQVPALLYRPEGADETSPAIVNIHGGPNWAFQFIWYPVMSHFAARGWTVLAPNYRGSTGYGKKWGNANRFEMGRVDTDDCAAGVQYLIENKLADPNRIAVSGRSHGGYLTMTCMTNYPELWAAGSAVVPFLNWIKSHYESREDLQHWNIENMGDPVENEALWIERSPYFHLHQVNAPVQLICGGHDPRCPASDSIDARDKLIELGKDVELLLYENEGHTFLNLDNVIDSETRRVEFLAGFLEREGSTIQ
jgi:dipeptidyl aminopeptidase/acylaminoacyl peptidase